MFQPLIGTTWCTVGDALSTTTFIHCFVYSYQLYFVHRGGFFSHSVYVCVSWGSTNNREWKKSSAQTNLPGQYLNNMSHGRNLSSTSGEPDFDAQQFFEIPASECRCFYRVRYRIKLDYKVLGIDFVAPKIQLQHIFTKDFLLIFLHACHFLMTRSLTNCA